MIPYKWTLAQLSIFQEADLMWLKCTVSSETSHTISKVVNNLVNLLIYSKYINNYWTYKGIHS